MEAHEKGELYDNTADDADGDDATVDDPQKDASEGEGSSDEAEDDEVEDDEDREVTQFLSFVDNLLREYGDDSEDCLVYNFDTRRL